MEQATIEKMTEDLCRVFGQNPADVTDADLVEMSRILTRKATGVRYRWDGLGLTGSGYSLGVDWAYVLQTAVADLRVLFGSGTFYVRLDDPRSGPTPFGWRGPIEREGRIFRVRSKGGKKK